MLPLRQEKDSLQSYTLLLDNQIAEVTRETNRLKFKERYLQGNVSGDCLGQDRRKTGLSYKPLRKSQLRFVNKLVKCK